MGYGGTFFPCQKEFPARCLQEARVILKFQLLFTFSSRGKKVSTFLPVSHPALASSNSCAMLITYAGARAQCRLIEAICLSASSHACSLGSSTHAPACANIIAYGSTYEVQYSPSFWLHFYSICIFKFPAHFLHARTTTYMTNYFSFFFIYTAWEGKVSSLALEETIFLR